jgi:hypothetical protein
MNSFKSRLGFLLPFIIIFPFAIISFFNHPALDDWWYAEVYKQYGFAGAQHYWYTHYTARFFSNVLMTLEPLSFGWVEGHKIMPIVFIALLLSVFFYVSKVFFKNHASSKAILPLCFTATYLLIQRDYFEAIYWLSANVVYQYTMLYFMLHLTLVYEIYFLKQSTSIKKTVAIMLAIAIVGSNETLGGLILAEAIVLLYYSHKKSRLKTFSILLTTAVILSWIIMFMARGNWDKIKVATGEHLYTFDLFLAVKHSLISAGYYSLFLMGQMFFWCLVVLSIPVFNYLFKSSFKLVKSFHLAIASAVCFLLAFTIYFISIYPTGILIPPLRVTNVAMVFLFSGIVLGLTFLTEKFTTLESGIRHLNKYRYLLMTACILTAIIGRTQYRQLLNDLLSGKASSYNKAMYSRYNAIKNHSDTTTLLVPKIIDVPRSIVATDISGPVSENMAIVFGKNFKVRIVEQTE